MSLIIARPGFRNGRHASLARSRDVASNARTMDRLFNELWRGVDRSPVALAGERPAHFVPHVDVSETEEAYRVSAELPGIDEKDLGIVLEDGVLTLKGEKKSLHEEGDSKHRRVESLTGSFERKIRFGGPIVEDEVKAAYTNGVLTVTLPKPEEAQPRAREIPVESR